LRGCVQAADLRLAEPLHASPRMKMRAKQDLVREDVADPGNDLLVHQKRLDLPPAFSDGTPQVVEVELRGERIRPQPVLCDERLRIVCDADMPEHPPVGVSKMAAVGKIEADPLVRWGIVRIAV